MSDFWWSSLSDNELMQLKFSELELDLKHSPLMNGVERLYRELKDHGLKFRPSVWVGNEWFCPDGIGGFAIPYYLFHPRLMRLHRQYGGWVEGRSEKRFMMFLRHETGHAIDNAYRLRRSKSRQQLFGLSSTPYPESYSPVRYSKRFVRHIESGYAQAHPDEDWAETFAVWLTPGEQWRNRYENWPAMQKLQMMNQMMKELKGRAPLNTHRKPVSDINRSHRILGSELRSVADASQDRRVQRIFSSHDRHERNLRAVDFLKQERSQLIDHLSEETGRYRYEFEDLVDSLTEECQRRQLRLKQSPQRSRIEVMHLLKHRIGEGRIRM